jgi:hypothetical protein
MLGKELGWTENKAPIRKKKCKQNFGMKPVIQETCEKERGELLI